MSLKIGNTALGVDQLKEQTPIWYQALLGALVTIVVPSTGTYISQIPSDILSDSNKVFIGVTVTWVVALFYAVGFFLGKINKIENTNGN